MLPAHGLEVFVTGSLAVLALELMMLAAQHGPPSGRGDAPLPQRAAAAGGFENGTAVRCHHLRIVPGQITVPAEASNVKAAR